MRDDDDGEGTRIADSTGVARRHEAVRELLAIVFGISEYLVTDESSVYDFPGTRSDIRMMIFDAYGVDIDDIEDGNLLRVLERTHPEELH